MEIGSIYSPEEITLLARQRFEEERKIDKLTGWFLILEIQKECGEAHAAEPGAVQAALSLREAARRLPLWLSGYSIFAGTQDDAFARSYALINPAFRVDSFTGYCDPTAVFDDIEPDGTFTPERIGRLRETMKETPYAKRLGNAYKLADGATGEAVFFVEQVTGHLIPDLRFALENGISGIRQRIQSQGQSGGSPEKKAYWRAMGIALEAAEVLAARYAELAREEQAHATGKRLDMLKLMEKTLRKVPRQGAETLYEAIQSFLILWQAMCMEQAPNPFAFSVGNADRIFEKYRLADQMPVDQTAALLKHFLVFFNVADRSWAISQNILLGGRDLRGNDLSNPTTYAFLDAYFGMNLPQPILSVKLHRNTPPQLYEALGRFFFTSGCLTPSLFNDDTLFQVLENGGIEREDLPDYAVAGCQEPLIMGMDNGNTTNSWLNLPKILELTIHGGISSITGERLGRDYAEMGYPDEDLHGFFRDIRAYFYGNLDRFVERMILSANEASIAVSHLQVPFLSGFMGGIESGIDVRDTHAQGTKYNASGCLIHGLAMMADCFTAIDDLLEQRPQDLGRFLMALKTGFRDDEGMRQFLLDCPKYGNNIPRVDDEAAFIANKVCDILAGKKNYLGNAFRPDFSSPSTHLMYGYWVGATPDGRKAREMLSYGVDPLYGEAGQGLGARVLSAMKLPYGRFTGGYASHLGVDPGYFKEESLEQKGLAFRDRIIVPLFFNPHAKGLSPSYLYVNVTTPGILRMVLKHPKEYAPSGVYIVRIHGTFVNFLDLSPEIQDDIMKRLDLQSTRA